MSDPAVVPFRYNWPTAHSEAPVTRLTLLAGLLAAAPALAAPVPTAIPNDTVTDPAKFVPTRRYAPREGTAVGVLVADAVKVMGRDGRSSQPDAIAFAADGGSYNWLYVPVDDAPQITGLQVKVGTKGETTVVYPKLSMASPKTTKGWGVSDKFALVEVTVNDGKGAPADEAFVASGVRVLDGTKAYPLKAADCVSGARAEFAKHTEAIKKDLDAAMAKSQKAALEDKQPSGKVATDEVVHASWITADEQLAVTVLTKWSDGAWQKGRGGANPGFDPPVPPGGGAIPPPPDFAEVTWGTGFGVEFGRRYLFNKDGKLAKTVTLSPTAFKLEVPPPPAAGPPRGIDPPLPPIKK